MKYPSLTFNMPLLCNIFNSGSQLVRYFVTEHQPNHANDEYIDDVLLSLLESGRILMDPSTKQKFIADVDSLLQHMMCSLTYEDIPIEQMRGLKSIKGGYAIRGHNVYTELDKNGNLVMMVQGCHNRPNERRIILFEDPEKNGSFSNDKLKMSDHEGFDISVDDLNTTRASWVLRNAEWSTKIRGNNDRIIRLLTRNNFFKALNSR